MLTIVRAHRRQRNADCPRINGGGFLCRLLLARPVTLGVGRTGKQLPAGLQPHPGHRLEGIEPYGPLAVARVDDHHPLGNLRVLVGHLSHPEQDVLEEVPVRVNDSHPPASQDILEDPGLQGPGFPGPRLADHPGVGSSRLVS